MLQVTDNGAIITLLGKGSGKGNGLFWFGSALLIGAVGVAMAMSILPERLAIGALAFLIVGSFVFNRQRAKLNSGNLNKGTQANINSGILKVRYGAFTHNLLGKKQQIIVMADDMVSVYGTQLSITSPDGSLKCQISGFESEKEAQIMQAILQGQKLNKRHANIKMQSN